MSTSTTAEPSSPLVIVSKEQIVGRAWARYYPFWERCLLWRVLVRSPGGVLKERGNRGLGYWQPLSESRTQPRARTIRNPFATTRECLVWWNSTS